MTMLHALDQMHDFMVISLTCTCVILACWLLLSYSTLACLIRGILLYATVLAGYAGACLAIWCLPPVSYNADVSLVIRTMLTIVWAINLITMLISFAVSRR